MGERIPANGEHRDKFITMAVKYKQKLKKRTIAAEKAFLYGTQILTFYSPDKDSIKTCQFFFVKQGRECSVPHLELLWRKVILQGVRPRNEQSGLRRSGVKMLLVILFVVFGVSAEPEQTTTKTYDLEVPGSDPIRIVEGEPLWRPTTSTRLEERAFKNKKDRDENLLHQFLTSYPKKNKHSNKEEYLESIEVITKPGEEPSHRLMDELEKQKSWDMVHYQKHNHPYDDKKGWVSMEPVPWSISKVSKWESNHKPSPKPWEDDYDEGYTKPTPWTKPTNYDVFYLDNRPNSKPIFAKPSTTYGQKVHVDYHNKKYQHKHDDNCHDREDGDDDIITDGRPADFPQPYEANRRKGTEIYPENHPFGGEGEWVLLSTTKGYKHPHQRQRALQINPEAIGAHRSVRLTVLPPLKSSKVNMTTSHGGLLQVESSFQTVEQSRKQLKKKEKLKKRRPQKQVRPIRQQQIVAPAAVTTTRRNSGPDSSTVLAAVGAGMIPATMAMLVPIALGAGRRKREIDHVTGPPTMQITLPRNLY